MITFILVESCNNWVIIFKFLRDESFYEFIIRLLLEKVTIDDGDINISFSAANDPCV
jgi:hypothetical protein